MTRTIPVRSHTRRMADKPKLLDNAVHQQLWNEFVGNVLAMELETELPKLLPDLSREDIARLRETY